MNDAQPNPVTAPAVSASPKSYEDCIGIIDAAMTESDAANLKSALTKIRAFLQGRVGKRTAEKEGAGGAAVKAAVAQGRTFIPYQPKPIEKENQSGEAFK